MKKAFLTNERMNEKNEREIFEKKKRVKSNTE